MICGCELMQGCAKVMMSSGGFEDLPQVRLMPKAFKLSYRAPVCGFSVRQAGGWTSTLTVPGQRLRCH